MVETTELSGTIGFIDGTRFLLRFFFQTVPLTSSDSSIWYEDRTVQPASSENFPSNPSFDRLMYTHESPRSVPQPNLRVLSSPRTQWELSLLHPSTHPNASYTFNLFWRRAHGMGASQRRVVWGTQNPHNARFQPWELSLIRRMGAVRSLSAGFVCQSKTTKPTVPRKTIKSPSPCSPVNPSLIPLFSLRDSPLSSPYPLTLSARVTHPLHPPVPLPTHINRLRTHVRYNGHIRRIHLPSQRT